MASTMQLDVVSAEEEIFSGLVTELIAPGAMGDLGIMPKHSQLITTLKTGELRYFTEEGDVISLFVAGGLMEIQPHVVTVLADTAVRAEDLDEKKSQAAVEAAELALDGKDPADMDYEAIQTELEAAKAQIEMLRKIGNTLK